MSNRIVANGPPTGSNDLWLAEQDMVAAKKKSKPESKFLTKVKKTFEKHDAFFHKIPDLPHYKGQKTRFDIEKPFDAFAIWDGVPMAIEGKYFREYSSFGLRNIRFCQEKGLNRYAQAGGRSFIFLGVGDRLLIFDWREIGHDFRYTKKQLMGVPYYKWDSKQGIYLGLKNTWMKKIKTKSK